MGKFHLTNRAVTDLSEIADFTIQTFGVEQARFYRDGLNNCFEILAENPQLGRSAAELAPNPKRFEYQSLSLISEIGTIVSPFIKCKIRKFTRNFFQITDKRGSAIKQ